MKKTLLIFILISLFILSFTLTACGDTENVDNNAAETTAKLNFTTSTESKSEEAEKEPEIETYSTDELVKTLHIPDIFASVLKTQTKVCDIHDNSFEYLHNYIHYFDTIDYVYVSVLDLDNNNIIDVIVLDALYFIVTLSEYEGTVYAHQFRYSGLIDLRIDGTHGWSEQAGDVSGIDKLQFVDGYKWPIGIELERIERVEDNIKFYINEVEVSEEEYNIYKDTRLKNLAEEAPRYQWKNDFKTPDYMLDD